MFYYENDARCLLPTGGCEHEPYNQMGTRLPEKTSQLL